MHKLSCHARSLTKLNTSPAGHLTALVLYFALSCWTMGSTLQQFSVCLPVTNQNARTVPIFNAWTIWWNADRVSQGLAGYWDAPIFFPHRAVFAYSEPQPATLAVAPIVWLTRSPATAYNVYLFGSLTLNGYVTFLTLRRQSFGFVPSIITGAMVLWLPISVREIEVLQLVPVWPIVWAWDSIRRYGLHNKTRAAIETSCAGVLCFYTCIHHALFFAVCAAMTIWPLIQVRPKLRSSLGSILAVSIGLLMVAIVYIPMRNALDGETFHRSESLVQQLAATPKSLITLPKNSWFFADPATSKAYSPGWLKLTLAFAGLVAGLCRPEHRRWTVFLGLTILVSILLANAPNIQFRETNLWHELGRFIPGIRQVRNVYRFVYLYQIATILLAALSLNELTERLRSRFKAKFAGPILAGLVGLAGLFEVPAPTNSMVGLPDLERHRGWTTFVREELPEGKSIACLPLPPGRSAADFEETVRWMYLGTLHGKPMINGYSGFFPEDSLSLNEQMTKEGFSPAVLSRLSSWNVHFVVARRTSAIASSIESSRDSNHQFVRVFQDENGIDVYRLEETSDSVPPKSAQ